MADKQLPEDVIREILLKLPVELIFRLRVTCKAWRSLTSDPTFIKAHTGPAKTAVILQSIDDCRYPFHGNYYMDIHDGRMRIEKAPPVLVPPRLTKESNNVISLEAYCDGFLCLRDIPCSSKHEMKNPYFICNLARRNWTAVTIPPNLAYQDLLALYFHLYSGEYRLLLKATKKRSKGDYFFEILVYSVQEGTRGSWRKVDNFFYDDDCSTANDRQMQELDYGLDHQLGSQVSLSECIYWLSSDGCTFMHAIDIEIEKFRMILLPQQLDFKDGKNSLIKLDGGSCLGLCHVTRQLEIQMWSLMDRGHGSKEDWIRLHTIAAESIMSSLPGKFEVYGVLPLMVSNEGDELLLQLNQWDDSEASEDEEESEDEGESEDEQEEPEEPEGQQLENEEQKEKGEPDEQHLENDELVEKEKGEPDVQQLENDELEEKESEDKVTYVLYNLKSKAIIEKIVPKSSLDAWALWKKTLSSLSCSLENTSGVEIL